MDNKEKIEITRDPDKPSEWNSSSATSTSGTGANHALPASTPGAKTTNTIFIHKLYNILEDKDLEDLIWWSSSGQSFFIKPTEKFSKALATYFKHTNITSFVRQLNIYGFHKVSNDHQYINYPNNNNSNDNDSKGKEREDLTNETIKIWEFKHSAGIFKKGDVEGLKLIKRRSSSRNISAMNQKKNLVSMQLNSSINNNVMPANTFMEANNDKKNRAPFGRPNNGNEPMIQGDLGINAGHFPYSQRVQQPQAQPQKHIQYQRYPYTPYSSVDSNTYQNNRRKQLNMSPNQYNEEDESSTHGKFSVSEIDDLRSINQDMAKLIGFMEYFVTLHLDSGKYKIDDDPQKQNWENFQNELANFKNNVIKRLHTKLGASHLLQEQYQRQVQQQQFLKDKIYPRQPEPLLPHHHHSHPILVTHPIGSSMSASQMVPIRPHTAPVAAIPSLLSSGQSYYGSVSYTHLDVYKRQGLE